MKAQETKKEGKEFPNQGVALKSGNEMAALAAKHINFHLMGYYPITPSTEVAEELDAMKAEGEHEVMMVPGDGEHGAAGICYGATTAGGRVFNATSANGLLYALEQLPVQSGTRLPMVLDIAARTVSGPLDIRCDHSDIMMTLNTGWLILMAKDPQMVYDMNIIAVKWGEHKDVRLPVIVCYDGFFTSHQKRRVHYFEDSKIVQNFIGKFEAEYTSVDPLRPVSFGPYMNDPDLINNKYQQSQATLAAYRVLPEVLEEYARISGRKYDMLTTYKMEDAEAALFVVNSAGDTAMVAVDNLRAKGKKVGLVIPNVIRPFPKNEIQAVFRNVKAVCVADRQDTYGGWGGNMTLEVKAALKDDLDNRTLILSRIYGLGGKEFFVEDAEELLLQACRAAESGVVDIPFDYHGANPGEIDYKPEPVAEPLSLEALSFPEIKVSRNEDGTVKVGAISARNVAGRPKRIAAGHGACPGCGIFPNVDQFLKAIDGYVVTLWHTGCGMVVTTGYPYSSHRSTYIHNLFQNGAATLSGVVEMFHERKRRGEIPEDLEITFVMVTGDGGNDIGMGPTIGSAVRNHRMIIIEYDNQGYMNTGSQLSFSTPMGHSTSTSNVGPYQTGKSTHHKDTAQIMAATHIPYVFTASEADYKDFMKKAAKANEYAKDGLVYGKILSACPLNWRSEDSQGAVICQKAIDCNFFPLYEVEYGITTLNYDPEAKEKKIPVSEWLKTMGKTRHLVKPENKGVLDTIQAEVDRRWARIRAMSESPCL